jgi:hypothetical protein
MYGCRSERRKQLDGDDMPDTDNDHQCPGTNLYGLRRGFAELHYNHVQHEQHH